MTKIKYNCAMDLHSKKIFYLLKDKRLLNITINYLSSLLILSPLYSLDANTNSLIGFIKHLK